MIVPKHLPFMPYTHVTSARVCNLGSVTVVIQSSACGGWLGMSFCLLMHACGMHGDVGILHRSRGDSKLPTTRLKRTEC